MNHAALNHAGALKTPAMDPPSTLQGPLARFGRSIKVQMVALMLVFIVPPLLLYSVFRSAEDEKRALLLDAVHDNAQLVGKAMEPILKTLQPRDFMTIQNELARFGADGRTIKVLFNPKDGARESFIYIASSPWLGIKDLEQEHDRLKELGVLDRLAGSCSGNEPLGERVSRTDGNGEVITWVTPVQSERGCWAVVVAANAESVMRLIDGRPYWTRPEARMAIAVYGATALLVFLIFAAVWSALASFRRTAARVEQGQSFATSTGVPELAQVGREFDGMVARLKRATDVLRQAAEDNAHAFKGPIAVIRQAVELVGKRATASGDAQMGVTAIAASCDRLEGLVRSAQRLDTATADLLETGWGKVDLSALVNAFAEDYRLMLGVRQEMLKLEVASNVKARGRDDILETILENLVDNAISFSPAEEQVTVRLAAKDGMAVLTVEDRGPGVEPARLSRIFERYYSSRPTEGRSTPTEMHFGIGLWLVHQHALALGGSVRAENRKSGGLAVEVTMPLATA